MPPTQALDTLDAAQRPPSRKTGLLRAALKLFAARGVHGTSVPDIAREAGVAVGTLYCHFPSKEAMANHLVVKCCQDFCGHLWEGFPHDADLRHQFGFFWRRYLGFAMRDPDKHVFLHQRAKDLELDEKASEALRTVNETENWVLDRGAASGGLANLPTATLGAMVHGAARGLIQAHLAGRVTLDDFLVSQTEERCWKAIATP